MSINWETSSPALQVLLGGGRDGKGRFSDKVIKIPSQRTRCFAFYLK
jgi:sulfite reductase (ferredoxin)